MKFGTKKTRQESLKTGGKYGRLTILSQPYKSPNPKQEGRKVVDCLCECGAKPTINVYRIQTNQTKSCGCFSRDLAAKRIGPLNQAWRGGRTIEVGGYARVLNHGHHRAAPNGYVKEHILVMEEKIGRDLLPGETIHHINGVKDDNRPENLELWDRNHCSGQRHIEKMAFHVQEIVSKSSDAELQIILTAIQNRMEERGLLE